jgi:hypothetical protein
MDMDELLSQLAREAATEAAENALADHVNRRKPGEPPPSSVHTGPTLTILGVMGCAIITLIAVAAGSSVAVGQPIDGAWFVVPFFSAIAIWMCLSCYDGFVRSIEWNTTDVRFRKWNGERAMSWDDILGFDEKSYPPHVRIAFRDGTGFGISETMKGSRYFLRILERRLGPDLPNGKRRLRRLRGKKR